MCSVVGYIGKNYCRSIIMEGLTRLEYRGYDSAGFVCLHPQDQRLIYTKAQGGVKNLINNLENTTIDGFAGIGHTRWSTHGIASTENAHPHFDCNKNISIVHNGIIENYLEIKTKLEKSGHVFYSQTDTEVVAHLLEELLISTKDLNKAIVELVKHVKGAYALAFLIQDYPDTILLIRKSSPLCIGYGDNEVFIASDALGFAGKTNQVLFVPDKSFALVKQNKIELYDFEGESLPLEFQIVDINWSADGKQGYEHYMLKEIYEQKKVIQGLVHRFKEIENNLWNQLGFTNGIDDIRNLDHIYLIGCGSSWHAANIAKIFFENIANIQTSIHLSSELRHSNFFAKKSSIAIALSQSGETADTLESLRFLNEKNIHTIALTNVKSSTITRESKGYFLTHAGPEIAVASTKVFSAQLACLYWISHKIAFEKSIINKEILDISKDNLLITAELLEGIIEDYKQDIVEKLAPYYSKFKYHLFLGKFISYPIAMEAALKLKEISYIFTEACPAGELKHGLLALIDQDIPVFMFSSMDNNIYKKLVINAQEIKARSGHLVTFAFEGQKELIELSDYSFILPQVKTFLEPLALTGIMQFFAYQIAKNLNRPIDKPRNLAKSVTVE